MKKGLITTLSVLALCFWAVYVFAQDEITIPDEALPVVNKAALDTVIIRYFTKQAQVIVRKGFMQDGQFVSVGGKDIAVTFVDVEDNPDTPEDETSTAFTDFINSIKIDKKVLKTIMEDKLK